VDLTIQGRFQSRDCHNYRGRLSYENNYKKNYKDTHGDYICGFYNTHVGCKSLLDQSLSNVGFFGKLP